MAELAMNFRCRCRGRAGARGNKLLRADRSPGSGRRHQLGDIKDGARGAGLMGERAAGEGRGHGSYILRHR